MRKIVILDDNQTLAHNLARNLLHHGYFVVVPADPNAALPLLEKDEILLSDFFMPEMTGLEVAHSASAQGWAGPLILMSASSIDLAYVAKDCPHLHATLNKPFLIEELLDKLRALDRPKPS